MRERKRKEVRWREAMGESGRRGEKEKGGERKGGVGDNEKARRGRGRVD
jgi:hypothetical protein